MIVGHYDSLTEVQKIVDDVLLAGVIEEIIEEGGLIPRLPLTLLSGKSYNYNREVTLPSGEWISMYDTITSSTGVTYSEVSVTLKILVEQSQLANFIAETYTNPIEPARQALKEAQKGYTRTLEDMIIYGNNTSNAKEPDGLHALVDSGMQLNQGSAATGAALSLDNLDQLIDLVRGGPPDLLLMSRAIFRRINQIGRMGSTNFPLMWIEEKKDGIARRFLSYMDIPMLRSDYMLMTETISGGAYSAKTGGATGSIFAVKFGHPRGFYGLIGDELMKVIHWDHLENQDVMQFRLRSYFAMALGSTKSLARLDGIRDLAVVI